MYNPRQGYVYIMASSRNGTLYVGVTSNLQRRVYEHKNNLIPKSFTTKYRCYLLVYYEVGESILWAIEREKQIKWGSRKDKIDLIEQVNSEWRDLYSDIIV